MIHVINSVERKRTGTTKIYQHTENYDCFGKNKKTIERFVFPMYLVQSTYIALT